MTKKTNIEWTESLRTHLYIEVIQEFGHPSKVPVGSRGKPVGMSKKDFLSALEDIGILIGVGKGKAGALANQLAWVYATPGTGCHQGHWNNKDKNIKAATIAGYFDEASPKTVLYPDGSVNVIATTVANHTPEPGVISRAWSAVKAWFS